MGEKSKIQWTGNTYNPWHGCQKVSAGCKFCYMFRDKERYGQDPTIVMRSKTNFNAPLRWKEPGLVFTCSWSDWFIEAADAWRDEAWAIIKATPHLTYQILTKRPERIADHLPADWGTGYPNVWLGVSVENQATADFRIPILASVPAVVRFLSMEPLLGPVDLTLSFNKNYWAEGIIGWVIVGGESGNDTGKYRYRAMSLEWLNSIITQCYRFGVPLFIKQMGTHLAKVMELKDRHGGDLDQWPDAYKIRQFPKSYQP